MVLFKYIVLIGIIILLFGGCLMNFVLFYEWGKSFESWIEYNGIKGLV